MRYKLTGASQNGVLKNGENVTINNGDEIIKIEPISFWHRLKAIITGLNWYYFKDLRIEKLFLIHDSIIERYFEQI